MSQLQFRSFIELVACGDLGTVHELALLTKHIGSWPDTWVDRVHEDDGGSDEFGLSLQNGIDILKA